MPATSQGNHVSLSPYAMLNGIEEAALDLELIGTLRET